MREPRFEHDLVMLGYKVNQKLRGLFEIYFDGNYGFSFEKTNSLGDVMWFEVTLDKIRVHILNHTDWDFSKTIDFEDIEKFANRFIRLDIR